MVFQKEIGKVSVKAWLSDPMSKLLISFLLISFLTRTFLVPTSVNAASGVTVTPSIARLDLSVDKPEIEIFYTNNTNTDLELDFSSQDFNGLSDGLKINFLQPSDAQNYHYSLSSWLTFNQKSLPLAAGEQGSVKVSIDKDKLPPGGHYAAVLATILQPNNTNRMQVQQVLSSLLFVRTSTGQETDQAVINNFQPESNFWQTPEKMLLRFQNSGNTDLIPYGEVEIKDPFNKKIGHGILNEGSFVVLPETIRRFDIPVKFSGTVWLPGIYSAELKLHYGKQNQSLGAENKFFVLGLLPEFILWLIAIVVLIILLKKYKLVVRVKRKD
jgi:hypothetical protein